ncbi:MAG: TIGR04222 domain-containing membrane protein [Betaproteobacteria bacterium]
MNPFELTGFSFLGFYLLVGVVALLAMRAWIRHVETANSPPAQNMTDPYLIAYLRDGENEALRVATVALLDRGLLIAVGETLKTKNAKAFGVVQRPIEKAILQHFTAPGEGHKVFKDVAAMSACTSYGNLLKQQGMIADAGVYMQRLLPALAALGLLIAVTWTKISIAFSQGRHNVGFLVALTILFSIIAIVIWRRRRTARGDEMMTDLRSLFSRLKDRAKSMHAGGQTNEAALLAAVFGLSALPVASFPFLEKLYPVKTRDGGGCGSSDSSSSCSSGSSCGGGCGGGGCGG